MDVLDRVLASGADLLDRIDAALLTLGAPSEHPIWTLTRRVGATPATAVAQIAALSPDRLREPITALHREAEACRYDAASLPARLDSQGAAAEAYAIRRVDLIARLSDGSDALAGRLGSTAAYLDDAAGWVESSRRSVASALAACLGSREAVTLRAAPAADHSAIVAAADLGAHVLGEVARCIDAGWDVQQRWAGRLAEVRALRPTPLDLRQSGRVELR